jgi:hypothetical protein
MGQDCTVIAFTCDRAGVGQSMAVASVALLLAANGQRVLTIDWDLAKPSLAKYFISFLPTDALETNDGVIDVVWTYASAVRSARPTDIPDLQLRFAVASPIECAIPDELRLSSGGELHLLAAGREPRRSQRVIYFSWGEFFDSLDGEGLLAMLWREMKRRYDHILIDCPQISNASRFPILSAHVLASCFTMDRESMEAGAGLARWATERLPARRLFVCPLAMRVAHGAEIDRLEEARKRRESLFQQFALFPVDAHFPSAPEVGETPYFVYERILPPLLGDRDIMFTYQRLAAALVNQPELEWRTPDWQQRTKYQAAYRAAIDRFTGHRVQPLLPPYSGHEAYAFVSYARQDRDEVMPVLQELLNLGWRLWWDQEIPGGSEWQLYLRSRIERATHMLVFLSARSVRSTWVAEEIRLAQEFGKPFLSIRLDWSEMPEESQRILSRYQLLDNAAVDFREQLGRGMERLRASSGAS